MNATEEYLTEAFKEQGLVIQETIEQILAESKIASDQSSEMRVWISSISFSIIWIFLLKKW